VRSPRALICSLAAASLVLAGCGSAPPAATARPEEVRARITTLLPAGVADRPGWAIDIYAAFDALRLEPSLANICAVLAVTEQESTFRTDPTVPGLGRIAREEIDRRAERAGVPPLLVQAALQLRSPDRCTGRSAATSFVPTVTWLKPNLSCSPSKFWIRKRLPLSAMTRMMTMPLPPVRRMPNRTLRRPFVRG